MDDKDGWWQSMLDLQTDLCKRYAAEVAKLRRENDALRRALAAYPSDATEMQDRVTMLETLISRGKEVEFSPGPPIPPYTSRQLRQDWAEDGKGKD